MNHEFNGGVTTVDVDSFVDAVAQDGLGWMIGLEPATDETKQEFKDRCILYATSSPLRSTLLTGLQKASVCAVWGSRND